MTKDLEQRVIDLEISLTMLQRQYDELSAELYAQQQRYQKLLTRVEELEKSDETSLE